MSAAALLQTPQKNSLPYILKQMEVFEPGPVRFCNGAVGMTLNCAYFWNPSPGQTKIPGALRLRRCLSQLPVLWAKRIIQTFWHEPSLGLSLGNQKMGVCLLLKYQKGKGHRHFLW